MSRVVTLSGSVQVEVDRLVDELVERVVAGVVARLAPADRSGYVFDPNLDTKAIGYGEVER